MAENRIVTDLAPTLSGFDHYRTDSKCCQLYQRSPVLALAYHLRLARTLQETPALSENKTGKGGENRKPSPPSRVTGEGAGLLHAYPDRKP